MKTFLLFLVGTVRGNRSRMINRRCLFVRVGNPVFAICFISILTKMSAFAIETWPCPGVCLTADYVFPQLEKSVILFDLGLPQTERPSTYGLSFAFWRSHYSKMMAGVQVAPLYGKAADAYGTQVGMCNSAERGVGVQAGLINIYDDVSFRLQVGLWNSQRLSLNWNYGAPTHSGGHGVQIGFVNMSSEGGHLQFGVFNVGDDTSVLQIGVFNFVNAKSNCFQIGIVNDRETTGSPFIGWRW